MLLEAGICSSNWLTANTNSALLNFFLWENNLKHPVGTWTFWGKKCLKASNQHCVDWPLEIHSLKPPSGSSIQPRKWASLLQNISVSPQKFILERWTGWSQISSGGAECVLPPHYGCHHCNLNGCTAISQCPHLSDLLPGRNQLHFKCRRCSASHLMNWIKQLADTLSCIKPLGHERWL